MTFSLVISMLIQLVLYRHCNGCIKVEDCVDSTHEAYSCDYTTKQLESWKSKYTEIASYGYTLGWHQSAYNLQHFLNGSGTLVQMSKEFLLDYKPVRERVDNNIETIICGKSTQGSGIIGRGRRLNDGDSMKETICYCASSYGTVFTDLYFASGGFTVHTSATVCITRNDNTILFTMRDITNIFYDSYNWEAAKGLSVYIPGFGDIPDSAAYCLEQNGMGKSFVLKTQWKDDDPIRSGSIDINSFDCKYQRDDNIDACKSPPWLFVVDTSGSMREDIAAVTQIVNSLISQRKGTVDEPRLYVLSEFNDPQIGPITSNADADLFLNTVSSVYVHGGDDCPEYAMSGILNAVQYAEENSYMFFFTDASAKDEEKQASVFAELFNAKTSFVPFISGECSSDHRRLLQSGNDLYTRLAFETGGFPIFTTHSNVEDVIPIVGLLTLKDTSSVYIMIDENSTDITETYIDVPIDSNLNNITLIVSSSFNSYPYLNIISTPSDNHLKTIILSTASLYSIRITPINEDAFGIYTIEVGTNYTTQFISFSVLSQTSLLFDYYLSTDIESTGFRAALFGGLSETDSLRITVDPLDYAMIKSIDYINIESLNRKYFVENKDITFGVDGYYAIFTSDDFKTVTNSFHILVIGTDINGYQFYRMMNTEISVRYLRLNILNKTDSKYMNIAISSTKHIPFEVYVDNTTEGYYITLNATSNLDNISLSIDDISMFVVDSKQSVLSISVTDDLEFVGKTMRITLTAININTNDYTYSQIDFNIISNINDTIPPQCTIQQNTFKEDCGSSSEHIDECNSSFWTAIIYAYDVDDNGNTENNYGIEWITAINNDPYSFSTIWNYTTFVSGNDDLYLLYTSSCCSTYCKFVVWDQINQQSSCELNVATKCQYDEIFGYAHLNETVVVKCIDIENNTNLNGGQLTRKCMENGKWSNIVNGQCYTNAIFEKHMDGKLSGFEIALIIAFLVILIVVGFICWIKYSKHKNGTHNELKQTTDDDMDENDDIDVVDGDLHHLTT